MFSIDSDQLNDLRKLWEAQDEAPEVIPCGNFPDVFFPEVGSSQDSILAKRLCRDCPIRQQCAEYGLKWEEFGIWGGLTVLERRRLRQRRPAHLTRVS